MTVFRQTLLVAWRGTISNRTIDAEARAARAEDALAEARALIAKFTNGVFPGYIGEVRDYLLAGAPDKPAEETT